MKAKLPMIKLTARALLEVMISGWLLLSSGIGVCQELPKATLEQMAKIPASKFTKVIKDSTSPDKRFASADIFRPSRFHDLFLIISSLHWVESTG